MANVGGPLLGSGGNDFLMGDARELTVGIDNFSNSGTFALRGLDGDDIIVGDLYDALGYDTEGDELYGGAGNDRIYGDTAPDLSSFGISSPWLGDPIWDTRIEGSSDLLYGDDGNDVIFGGAGSDQIHGGSGRDVLYGQRDQDFIYGDADADTVWAGHGNDQVYGGAGSDLIYGGDGNDALYGEEFNTSSGDAGDTIRGGVGNDDIRGGAGADRLFGDGGADRITGGGLSSDSSNDAGDICNGGTGNDFIDGSYGNDRLTGGTGLDTLTGGEGRDQFIYLSVNESRGLTVDIITDFNSAAADRINLAGIDAIPSGTDDGSILRDGMPFTAAGQIRITQDTTNFFTYVQINTDLDAAAEMTIRLNGLIALDRADFIL